MDWMSHGIQDGLPTLGLAKKWGYNETISWLQSFATVTVSVMSRSTLAVNFGGTDDTNPSTKKTVQDMATTTMLKEVPNDMPSPCGLNCTYTIRFDGHKNITGDPLKGFIQPVFWANWTGTESTVKSPMPDFFQLTNLGMGWADIRKNGTAYKEYPYYGSPELDIFLYTRNEMACYPHSAEL